MFKSFKILSFKEAKDLFPSQNLIKFFPWEYYRKPSKRKENYFLYQIFDDNFIDLNTTHCYHPRAAQAAADAAIIKTYSTKNLNVASNLAIYMKQASDALFWTFENQFNWSRQFTPNFEKYEQEVKKYLLLI